MSELEDKVNKGLDASKTLHSSAFQTALITIKARLFEESMETSLDQEEKRTEIWRKYQLLQWLEEELTNVVDTGTIATKELEQRNQNH